MTPPSPTPTEALWQLDATALAALIRSGEISATEATQAHLARLDEINPRLNVVVHALHEQALAQAREADARRSRGEPLGLLHGVPITTKITADQAGCPSDHGVRLFKEAIAREDSPVVRNLRQAGAILIGRTNSPAFAMRLVTDSALHGRTLNPWDRAQTAGGSSGGAGAAVAAGIGALAHGTDIGGSIRWPAFCNGIAGLRPTPGRIPSHNPAQPLSAPMAVQLMSVAGPMARSVRDLRLGLQVMAGQGHPADPLYLPVPLSGWPTPARRRAALLVGVKGVTIDPLCLDAVREAGRRLQAAGWEVEEFDDERLPAFRRAWEVWTDLALPEIRTLLEPLLATAEDPGLTTSQQAWWETAGPLTPQRQVAAYPVRHALMKQMGQFLEGYPLLVTPAGASPWAAADQDTRPGGMAWMLEQFGRFLFPAPLLGLPCLAVPVVLGEGRPLGVQVHAPKYREDLCLEAGALIEAADGPRPVVTPRF